MKLPVWLYESREFGGPCPERIRRVGSRKYGLVANYISGDAYTSPAILATVWRFHAGFGPGGGIEAGFIDAGIRGRLWSMGHGRYLGLGWKPRAAAPASTEGVQTPDPKGRGMFARSDIETAAEAFVKEALYALGLIWEPDEIAAEASALTDRAFGWREAPDA